MAILRTGISEAFWCDPTKKDAFKPAHISVMHPNSGGGTCWFDELFEGGIQIPDNAGRTHRALTMVLAGPPGTGKSTLAAELCYRAAPARRSLYLTSEAHVPWMIQNACTFGWKNAKRYFGLASPSDQKVFVAGFESEKDVKQLATGFDELPPHRRKGFAFYYEFLTGEPLPSHRDQGSKPVAPGRAEKTSTLIEAFKAGFDVVVVDSLNTLKGDKFDLFKGFINLAAVPGPSLIIAIIDSPRSSNEWDFVADIVVRLDSDGSSGYLLRSIEVVKARYQPHVWGKHQLKIYEPFKEIVAPKNEVATRRRRAHPYRKEGGIFIFPSIHYILSRLKAKSPTVSVPRVSSPVQYLDDFLDGGFPGGGCVGLIGGRGTHKSHLGYLQVLARLVDNERVTNSQPREKALVVSLRDSEASTRETMTGILEHQWKDKIRKIDQFIDIGDLEITYFPPGFITPEEFFHRLLLSIHRLRDSSPKNHVTLLFNSLDQLSSRFPLCAEQRMFIPGLIAMLSAEGVASYFVAAKDQSAGPEYYGLTSMAELIVSLKRRVYKRDVYANCVRNARSVPPTLDNWNSLVGELPEDVSTVLLTVERFAGGQPAGAAGLLELIQDVRDPKVQTVWRGRASPCPPCSEPGRGTLTSRLAYLGDI